MAKMIDAEKLNLLIRDDPEISGKMYARMKMHINEATVVDAVEVVHGRWRKELVKGFRGVFGEVFVCSKCETRYLIPNMNYCPNCGAKMDGDRNERC